MSRRHERRVVVLTTVLSLVALGFLMGCPPFQAREREIDYQEVGLIRLEGRFVPSEIVLVKGRPARIHLTSALAGKGQLVELPFLAVAVPIDNALMSGIELSMEQIRDLDGKGYRCSRTELSGTFRIVEEGEPVQSKQVDDAVEVAVVMTADLAAPHRIFLKKDVPVRLYVAKTKSEEVDDYLTIEGFGEDGESIETEIGVGEINTLEFTPRKLGVVRFQGTTTPNSAGEIVVVE